MIAERVEPVGERQQAAPIALAAQAGPAAATGVASVLAMQRGVGNAAVSTLLAARLSRAPATPAVSPPPVAASPPAVHHTQPELEAMTLAGFNTFAEAQADWASEPGLPAGAPKLPAEFTAKLRMLLEFARSEVAGRKPVLAGCGTMTVKDLVATGLDGTVRSQLRSYAGAVAQTKVTIQLQPISDVPRALVLGAAVAKLEAMPGPGVSHAIFKQTDADSLGDLVRSPFLDDFVEYCRKGKPLLEAPGAEIASYLALRAEGADPLSYRALLPDIRNYHRFEKAALDALVLNRGHTAKDKPLYLILHSSFDHNGAFHRDPNLTAVITDTSHLTLLIEGKETLADIESELRPLARRYGQGNRIAQVMLAGHGNFNVIGMAGKLDTAAMDGGTDSGDAERGIGVNSAPGLTADTDQLMATLLAQMVTDGSGRIVLNACLTASNAVAGPLDPNPARAAAQVQAAIRAQPSLASYLGTAAAASNVSVRGANASFGQVGLSDAAGNLDIVAARGADPKLTASKLEYVAGGNEPQGALRAVLEVWAQDRVATPPTTTAIDAVNNRLATEAASPAWNPRIIRTLYGIVAANPDNAELIRQLGECAGDLSELVIEAECRVSRLQAVPAAHVATIFTGLTLTTHWVATPRIPLVVLQRWLQSDASKIAPFLAQLGGPTFTCNSAKRFVDIPLLGINLAAMLPVADAPTASPGQLKLALLGVVGAAPDAACKAFLRAVVGTGSGFAPGLGIDGLLGGRSTKADVEVAIGVRGPAAAAVGGVVPAPPPNNVDADRDATNELRVEPMTRRGVAKRSLDLRRLPDVTSASVAELRRSAKVDIIGLSGDWYAIEHASGTAFVPKDAIRLDAAL